MSLAILKEVKGIYFKGGTAINKILLNYARLSEDVDFSIGRNLEDIKTEITQIINGKKIFGSLTKDKDVEGFTRLIVPYLELGKGTVFIDLNKRGRLLTRPEMRSIHHFYPTIPKFMFPCPVEHPDYGELVA